MVYHLERAIATHPQLAAFALYLHFKGKYDWKIVSGFRSPEEQHQDWLKGRDPTGVVVDSAAVVTDADAGQSPHNYGLALDFQPTYDKGATVSQRDDDPAYAELDELAPKFGLERITLPSTGRRDSPHVQLANWRASRDWLAKLAIVSACFALIAVVVTY